MRVAVLGAGAIGAYVGASLCRAGVEVHLIARGPQLDALRDRGVQVLSDRGDFAAHPHATDDPRDIGEVDYVFLGLKAHSYPKVGALLPPLLGPHTAVVAAQNGIPWWYFHKLAGPYEGRRIEAVDPGGETSAVMPRERAIGCVAYPAAIVESPGVIRHLEGTRFSIGEPDGTSSERCLGFSEAMVAGGLKCPVEPQLRDDIWIKLMGNAALNPISALSRATMVEICQHPNTRRVVELMMEETLDIAARLSALMGFNAAFPMSLIQMSSRNRGSTGHFSPPATMASLKSRHRCEVVPSGSPMENLVPSRWRITPGDSTVVAGNATQPIARSRGITADVSPPGSTASIRRPS